MSLAATQSSHSSVNSESDTPDQIFGKFMRDVRNVAVTTASAVLLSCSAPSTAHAEQLRLSISRNEDIMQVQESMLESWSIIDDVFFDSATLVRPMQTNAACEDRSRRQRPHNLLSANKHLLQSSMIGCYT